MIEPIKLTPEEIQELNVHAAQRILAENSNLLIDLDNELFIATQKMGEARIKVDQLKHRKNTIIEQNRALKSVISNG